MNPGKVDIVSRRIFNAKKTLQDIDILIENKLWNIAVNRLYYASFYAVTALLHNYDLDTKTHSGAQRMFGLHFIKPGLIDEKYGETYSTLQDMRQDADYDDMIDYEKDDVIQFLQPVREMIEAIEIFLQKE
jgi:uncharacterized protein